MGLLDKIKNVFWEEVEVDEEEEEETPVAKKVDIPKKEPKRELFKKPDPVKIMNEEEPVEQKVEEVKKPVEERKFKFTSYETQEIPVTTKEVPKFEEVEEEETKEEPVTRTSKIPMMFEDDDFYDDSNKFDEESKNEEKYSSKRELYPGKKETSYIESINKNNSYRETRNYYEKREKTTFKPSPIISPIYGILDKNYTKEEVITKTEVTITRNKDLDNARNKVLGLEKEKHEEKKVEEEKTLYDVNKNKPNVKGVTLQDADEYYNDLGLAYNVDYKDASKENKETPISRSKRVHNNDNNNNNDNLFDLIDSMYNKED